MCVPQLRVEAFEVLRPEQRVAEDVLIDVTRNPNQPEFSKAFYVESVFETAAQGASVLTLTARDAQWAERWKYTKYQVFINFTKILSLESPLNS